MSQALLPLQPLELDSSTGRGGLGPPAVRGAEPGSIGLC